MKTVKRKIAEYMFKRLKNIDCSKEDDVKKQIEQTIESVLKDLMNQNGSKELSKYCEKLLKNLTKEK